MPRHRVTAVALWCILCACSAIAAEPPTVIALGDSITRGVRSGVKAEETFAALLEVDLKKQNPSYSVLNVGIGGERTDGALARLEKDVLSKKPKVVLVMYGTNDSYVDKGATESRLTLQQYRKNLVSLVDRLRAQAIEPILMTEPRWAADTQNGIGENPNKRLEFFVQVCRDVAKEKKVRLVDHYAHWKHAEDKGVNLREWTTDGCHPNPKGHRELADRIKPILQESLRSP